MKLILTILLGAALVLQTACSNKITLLEVHALPADALDIVLVPAHYYGADAYSNPQWIADAEAVRAGLIEHHYWIKYREKINVHRLNISTSNDFFTSGTLWVPDDNRIKAFAIQHVPALDFSHNDQIIFVIETNGYQNDPMRTPGFQGPTRGDPNVTKIEMSKINVLVHEFGHSFGDLGDEYDKKVSIATWVSPYPNFATVQPNNTCDDLWGDLMNVVTPSPVINEPRDDRIVDCFPSSRTDSAALLFRPTRDMCLMDTNSPDSPFCPVCQRHLATLMAQYTSVSPATCPGPTNQFTSRISFEQAAAGALTLVDFDTDSNGTAIQAPGLGVLIDDQYSGNGVGFTAGVILGDPNTPFDGVSAPNVITDTSINLLERAPVAGYFDEPVCAVGLTATGALAELRVYDDAFNLIATIRSDNNTSSDDFIGIRADRPIHRFEYDHVSGSTFSGDDLRFGQ